MFEIGFWEIVLVGVVALVVVGPERLPGLARTAGLWVGKARSMVAQVKAEVDRELQLQELKQSLQQTTDLNELNAIKQELAERARAIERDLQAEFDDPGPPPGWTPDSVSAPPPPGWQPPLAEPSASDTPVSLEKPEASVPAKEPDRG